MRIPGCDPVGQARESGPVAAELMMKAELWES